MAASGQSTRGSNYLYTAVIQATLTTCSQWHIKVARLKPFEHPVSFTILINYLYRLYRIT